MARCAAAVLVALVAGCAADCTNANWRSRGYNDGYFGHPPQDLRLGRVCPGFADSSYMEGWRAGHDEWDRTIGSYGQD